MENNKWDSQVYLGEGIYAKFDGMYVKLMSDNYINPDNTILVDEVALKNLLEFVKVHAPAWVREE